MIVVVWFDQKFNIIVVKIDRVAIICESAAGYVVFILRGIIIIIFWENSLLRFLLYDEPFLFVFFPFVRGLINCNLITR